MVQLMEGKMFMFDQFSSVVFTALVVSASLVQMTEGCSCLDRHPQRMYCDAGFVLRGRILSKGNSTYQPVYDYYGGYWIGYTVWVERVYKGDSLSPRTRVELTTINDEAACGVPYLEEGSTYVFGGEGLNGTLTIDHCGYSQEWESMPEAHRKGLNYHWPKYCGVCKIVDGQYERPSGGRTCTLQGKSGCKKKFARCRQNKLGRCVWQGEPGYRRCPSPPNGIWFG